MLLKLDSILHRQQHINKTNSTMRCFAHTGSSIRTSTFIFIYVYALVHSFFGFICLCAFHLKIYVCIDNNFVADDWNCRLAILRPLIATPHPTHITKQKREWVWNEYKKIYRINDTNIIAYWKSETHKNWCGCGQTKSINSIQLTSVGLIRRFACTSFISLRIYIRFVNREIITVVVVFLFFLFSKSHRTLFNGLS